VGAAAIFQARRRFKPPPLEYDKAKERRVFPMSILLWLILGAVAGWIAGKIMGEQRGLGGNILVGILGAGLGGLAASLLGFGGVDGFNLYSLLIAVAGACLLLWIYGMLQKRAAR
jgi:uncharacterized membrane protein YeaQ/YmgE (transglycosylase-associated protein family)